MTTPLDVPALLEAVRRDPAGLLLRVAAEQGAAAVPRLLEILSSYLPESALVGLSSSATNPKSMRLWQRTMTANLIGEVVALTALMGAVSVLGLTGIVATLHAGNHTRGART